MSGVTKTLRQIGNFKWYPPLSVCQAFSDFFRVFFQVPPPTTPDCLQGHGGGRRRVAPALGGGRGQGGAAHARTAVVSWRYSGPPSVIDAAGRSCRWVPYLGRIGQPRVLLLCGGASWRCIEAGLRGASARVWEKGGGGGDLH
jgi:hypothetical protein